MPITTLTSREFNQDTSGAKKAASRGPVFITDRGHPAHVLLSIEEYRRLTGGEMSVAEALAQPDAPDFEFTPPRARRAVPRGGFVVMFVLDTNVVSELRRPKRADPKVAAWAASVPLARIFLSAVTIFEIELGALSVERRDKAQGLVLRSWIDDQILPRFEGRILPIDTVVAQRCAKLHAPDPRAERDALIAATALVHGMTVVTRNVADFEPIGVQTLNPWV